MPRPPVLIVLVLFAAGCAEEPRTFDGERAFAHLSAQVAMGPRVPGTPGHEEALAYFRRHLEATADRVQIHRFEAIVPIDSSTVEFRNVLAIFNPEARARLLFGAHWDTRPIADQEEDEDLRSRPVPGANDGASGVAVLLELATALKASPPGIGVDLVLFDGEDQGIAEEPESFALGSARFVADNPGYRPAVAIILDMVGREGTRIPREANSQAAAPRWVDMIWRIGREIGVTVLADTLGTPVMDDHIPFLRQGIAAVDLIDLGDPDWHTTRDLPENCSPLVLGEVGRLCLELIRRVEVSQEAAGERQRGSP